MTASATEVHRLKQAPADEEILPVMRARWSPRAFSDRGVPAADLRKIFEAARWAPSSYNEQPWRFLVGTMGSETHKNPQEDRFGARWLSSSVGTQGAGVDPGCGEEELQPQQQAQRLCLLRFRRSVLIHHAAGSDSGDCNSPDGGFRSRDCPQGARCSGRIRDRLGDGAGVSGRAFSAGQRTDGGAGEFAAHP